MKQSVLVVISAIPLGVQVAIHFHHATELNYAGSVFCAACMGWCFALWAVSRFK